MLPPTAGGTVRASSRVVLGRAVDPWHTPYYETPLDYRDQLPSKYIPEVPARGCCRRRIATAPRCVNDRTFGRGVIKNDHAISQRRRSRPLCCSLKTNPDLCRPGPRSHWRCGISDLSAPDQPSLGTRAMISAARCIAFTVPRSRHDRHAGLVGLYPAHQRRHLRSLFAGIRTREENESGLAAAPFCFRKIF